MPTVNEYLQSRHGDHSVPRFEVALFRPQTYSRSLGTSSSGTDGDRDKKHFKAAHNFHDKQLAEDFIDSCMKIEGEYGRIEFKDRAEKHRIIYGL